MPKTASVESPGSPSSGVMRIQEGRRGRVLVVDDEPLVGAAIRRTLSRQGDVDVMTSGVDALARIARGERWDLVLCDLQMPGMTGDAFQRELEALSPALSDHTVFMTGDATTREATAILSRHRGGYLEKPLDTEELRSLVRRAIECSRTDSEEECESDTGVRPQSGVGR